MIEIASAGRMNTKKCTQELQLKLDVLKCSGLYTARNLSVEMLIMKKSFKGYQDGPHGVPEERVEDSKVRSHVKVMVLVKTKSQVQRVIKLWWKVFFTSI